MIRFIKLLVLMAMIVFLAACGSDSTHYVTNEVTKEIPSAIPAQELAGYYKLPNGGYIEIVALNDGRVRLETQQLLLVNQDSGLGLIPSFSQGPHVLTAIGSLVLPQNLTYSASVNDLEQDGTNTDIVGSKRTELTLSLNSAGKLLVTVVVKDGTSIVSPVIVNRTLESL